MDTDGRLFRGDSRDLHALSAKAAELRLLKPEIGIAAVDMPSSSGRSRLLQTEHRVASASVYQHDLSSGVAELSILSQQLDDLRHYVDLQLQSVEVQVLNYWKRHRLDEPSPSVTPMRLATTEDLDARTRDLQDRLQRLETLLFCVPVPDFRKIDDSIRAIMNGDLVVSSSGESLDSQPHVRPDPITSQSYDYEVQHSPDGAPYDLSCAREPQAQMPPLLEFLEPAMGRNATASPRGPPSGAGQEGDGDFEAMLRDMTSAEERLQMLSRITEELDAQAMD
jgi:hypothetical protein